MDNKKSNSAEQVLQDINEYRKHSGVIIMELDGAQSHLALEAMQNALLLTAKTLEAIEEKGTADWEDGFDKYDDAHTLSHEMALIFAELMRIFVDALPNNLRALEEGKIDMQKLHDAEAFLRNSNG